MSKQILAALFALTMTGCMTARQAPEQPTPSAPAVEAKPVTPVAQVECSSPQSPEPCREPDVIFVPTPQPVVDKMLEVAGVRSDDVIYDLGSGDGRIVITAAKRFGTRGVGIDIDPVRIEEARAYAEAEGVTDKVEFRNQDLFETDFREATVVSLYLLPELNLKLRPILMEQLRPGTRIVSHSFDMGDWEPDEVVNVDGRIVYFWVVPERN